MINMILKKLRLSSDYTQEQVALTIGVSRQAVAKWENGTTTPDIYNCMALAKLYGDSSKRKACVWFGKGRGTRANCDS